MAAARKKPTKKAAKTTTVKKPKAKAAARKSPFGKVELDHFRDLLLERRARILRNVNSMEAEALKAADQDFSVDHMADHGSDNFEQDFNLKLLEGEAGQLEDIRDALLKIDGTHELPFGLCEACSDAPQGLCPSCPWIPASRLDVLPQARLCVQTKESEERSRR